MFPQGGPGLASISILESLRRNDAVHQWIKSSHRDGSALAIPGSNPSRHLGVHRALQHAAGVQDFLTRHRTLDLLAFRVGFTEIDHTE
jgi:hypothetical protein